MASEKQDTLHKSATTHNFPQCTLPSGHFSAREVMEGREKTLEVTSFPSFFPFSGNNSKTKSKKKKASHSRFDLIGYFQCCDVSNSFFLKSKGKWCSGRMNNCYSSSKPEPKQLSTIKSSSIKPSDIFSSELRLSLCKTYLSVTTIKL